MTTNKPKPVAFRWRVPIADSDCIQCGEGDWKFGTEKGGLPWWTRDSLLTTTQSEAYADACVREALEQAVLDVAELQAECEKLRKDAERYRWLSQRLVGASFDWDDEGMTILAFEMPGGVSIGAGCDKNIDAAMQETSHD